MTRLTPTLVFQRLDNGTVLIDEETGAEVVITDQILDTMTAHRGDPDYLEDNPQPMEVS